MKQATRFSLQSGWKLLIRDMEVNPAEVLRLAGLPADLFARKDTSLSPTEYFRLWQGLEQAAGTDMLPLKLGQALSVEAFDPPRSEKLPTCSDSRMATRSSGHFEGGRVKHQGSTARVS